MVIGHFWQVIFTRCNTNDHFLLRMPMLLMLETQSQSHKGSQSGQRINIQQGIHDHFSPAIDWRGVVVNIKI